MRPHLKYLRYVLMHKLYVMIAGVQIGLQSGYSFRAWVRQLWRLLSHDWSKFRPSEWSPYVEHFYGSRAVNTPEAPHSRTAGIVRARFDRAWLHHIHRNDHHWQHHVLNQDDGRQKVLLPEAWVADEMLADWMGAGSKIMSWPSLTECVARTVEWYAMNRGVMLLREPVRQRIEMQLHLLAERAGLLEEAMAMRRAQEARASLAVEGLSGGLARVGI